MADGKRLINKTKGGAVLAADVRFASTFLERAIGLMGRSSWPRESALFFEGSRWMPCNSIQTCFMRFPLDVVFLDGSMGVRSVMRGVKPWRMTRPVKGAISAIEMTSGTLPVNAIEIGDVLHVGD